MLWFDNDEQFTTGRAVFHDHHDPDGAGGRAKVFVRIEVAGLGPLLAQLDTGADWSVLDAGVAAELDLLDGDGEPIAMHTRLGPFDGRIERVALRIVADTGDSLEVEASVFVSRDWPGRTFLGYTGLLERIRFALDPQGHQFHFGQ